MVRTRRASACLARSAAFSCERTKSASSRRHSRSLPPCREWVNARTRGRTHLLHLARRGGRQAGSSRRWAAPLPAALPFAAGRVLSVHVLVASRSVFASLQHAAWRWLDSMPSLTTTVVKARPALARHLCGSNTPTALSTKWSARYAQLAAPVLRRETPPRAASLTLLCLR